MLPNFSLGSLILISEKWSSNFPGALGTHSLCDQFRLAQPMPEDHHGHVVGNAGQDPIHGPSTVRTRHLASL